MRFTLPLRAGGSAGALTVVLVTAGSLPAPAGAASPPVSVKLSDPRLSFGESAVVSGRAPASTAGRPAALEFRAPGAAGAPWRRLSTRVIRSGGRFRLPGRVDRSGYVRVSIASQEGGGEVLSSLPRRVQVHARTLVRDRRLHVTSGGRVAVAGSVRPGAAGLPVALEVRSGGRWATLDSARTRSGGRFALADRRRGAMSAPVRLRVSGRAVGLSSASRGLGRLEVYRRAHASWYGPGLYGNRLGCGGRLSAGRLGVAHKSLPCGTLVTFRRSGRSVRVPVIDRGPYVGGREYDLTAATAQRLGFRGHGPILATR